MRAFCRVILTLSVVLSLPCRVFSADRVRDMQTAAAEEGKADWGHWGLNPAEYSAWKTHSSRLIPLYSFGITLDHLRQQGSVYRSTERMAKLYTQPIDVPANPTAEYFDQTDVYVMQRAAADAGKKYIVLVVFDGMDWQTTWAAAIHKTGQVPYRDGRGTGLSFQDYRGTTTDYGYFATSPVCVEPKIDVDAQLVTGDLKRPAGYDWRFGGDTPWGVPMRPEYLIGKDREHEAPVTDSSASATSMTAGIKTFNGAVNMTVDSRRVETIAHQLQREKQMSIGVVTSVPISHATPASAYSNNVSRDDYQDLTRDLIGLPSVVNRSALPGVDVLIGCGWGETNKKDEGQGQNFVPGNRYLTEDDQKAIDVANGGKYVIAQRTAGQSGAKVLQAGAAQAAKDNKRLLGYFGVKKGHLPFRTADGNFDPTKDIGDAEEYSKAALKENPTLADMTSAALQVLETNPHGFWLMVEAGDVDWANHSNNIDNSIGAVHSGADAFKAICDWAEKNDRWKDTAVFVTSDHGHYLHLLKPEAIVSK